MKSLLDQWILYVITCFRRGDNQHSLEAIQACKNAQVFSDAYSADVSLELLTVLIDTLTNEETPRGSDLFNSLITFISDTLHSSSHLINSNHVKLILSLIGNKDITYLESHYNLFKILFIFVNEVSVPPQKVLNRICQVIDERDKKLRKIYLLFMHDLCLSHWKRNQVRLDDFKYLQLHQSIIFSDTFVNREELILWQSVNKEKWLGEHKILNLLAIKRVILFGDLIRFEELMNNLKNIIFSRDIYIYLCLTILRTRKPKAVLQSLISALIECLENDMNREILGLELTQIIFTMCAETFKQENIFIDPWIQSLRGKRRLWNQLNQNLPNDYFDRDFADRDKIIKSNFFILPE